MGWLLCSAEWKKENGKLSAQDCQLKSWSENQRVSRTALRELLVSYGYQASVWKSDPTSEPRDCKITTHIYFTASLGLFYAKVKEWLGKSGTLMITDNLKRTPLRKAVPFLYLKRNPTVSSSETVFLQGDATLSSKPTLPPSMTSGPTTRIRSQKTLERMYGHRSWRSQTALWKKSQILTIHIHESLG